MGCWQESKSHMLSILNFESRVTHRAVFCATLIVPIAGAICHFCLFGQILLFAYIVPIAPFCGFCFCLSRQQKKTPRPSGFLRILPLFRVQQTELVQFQMKACLYNHNIFLKFDCLFYIKLRLIKWQANFIASECRL